MNALLRSFAALATVGVFATRLAAAAPPEGRPVAKLAGPSGTAAAFSRDGKLLLTAGADSARVWHAQTFEPTTDPFSHRGQKLSLARISPDGKHVVTAAGSEVIVRDTAPPRASRTLRNNDKVWSADFSPDGSRVVTATADGSVRLFDVRSGGEVMTLKHPAAVKFAAFTPDGTKLVTVREPNAVDGDWEAQPLRVWDVERSVELYRKNKHQNEYNNQHEEWLRPVAFSADGRLAATFSAYTWTAAAWEIATGTVVCDVDLRRQALKWMMGMPTATAFTPDGRAFAVAGSMGVDVWRVESRDGRPPRRLARIDVDGVESVEFGPDGTRLFLGARWGKSGVWSLPDSLVLSIPQRDGEAPAHAFSPDGKHVAAGFASDGFTSIWEVPDQEQP